MKQFLKIMLNDLKAENFSRSELIKYGIIGPLVLLLITIIF